MTRPRSTASQATIRIREAQLASPRCASSAATAGRVLVRSPQRARGRGEARHSARAAGALALAVLPALVGIASACSRSTDAAEQREPAAMEAPVALGPHGQPLVHVDAVARERLDLGLARPAACSHAPMLRASARVIEDPSRRTTVRSPIAGRWIAATKPPVLTMGARLDPNLDLGYVEPRLSPVERADAAGRFAEARSQAAQAQAALDASAKALARVEQLNSEGKNASDRAVEEARARRDQDAARVAGAQENARALESLLALDADVPAGPILRLARAGELVELFARPGEEVDAGATLLTVEDFDVLRVRIDVPPAAAGIAPPEEARLASVFDGRASWTARFLAHDADATRSHGTAGWIYALGGADEARLRPGAALEAWLPSGAPTAGWSIPDSAVVRLGGRAWAYALAADGAFERVPVALDAPLPGAERGWFTRDAWAGDVELVVRGAQALLSTEIVGAQTTDGAGAEE